MSSKSKRKVTVDNGQSSKDTSEPSSRRPSVFERLGPNAVSNPGRQSSQERHSRNSSSSNDPSNEKCRNWLRTGTCSYGSSCRYQHPPPTFTSPTKNKTEKVRNKRKGRKKSLSPSPKRSKSSNSNSAHGKKVDHDGKIKSTVVVTRTRSPAEEMESVNPSGATGQHLPPPTTDREGHIPKKPDNARWDEEIPRGSNKEKSRTTPEKSFPEWPVDATQLDFKEELSLEIKRQQLKRELELEMQKEEKMQNENISALKQHSQSASSSSSSRSSSSSNSSDDDGSGTASSSSDSSSSSSSDDSDDDSSSSSSSSSSSTSSRGKRPKHPPGATQRSAQKQSTKHFKETNIKAKDASQVESTHTQKDRPKSRNSASGDVKAKRRSRSKDKTLSSRQSRKRSTTPVADYNWSKKYPKDKNVSPGRGRSSNKPSDNNTSGGGQDLNSRSASRGRAGSKGKGKGMHGRTTSSTKRDKDWPNVSSKERNEGPGNKRHKKKKNQTPKEKGFRGRQSPGNSSLPLDSNQWGSNLRKNRSQRDDFGIGGVHPRDVNARDFPKDKYQDRLDSRAADFHGGAGRDHSSPPLTGRKRHRSLTPVPSNSGGSGGGSIHHLSQIAGTKNATDSRNELHYKGDTKRQGLNVDSQTNPNRHSEDSRDRSKPLKRNLSPPLPPSVVSSSLRRSPKESLEAQTQNLRGRSYGGHPPPPLTPTTTGKDVKTYSSSSSSAEKREAGYHQQTNIYKWVRNRETTSPGRDRAAPNPNSTALGNRRDLSPDSSGHRKRSTLEESAFRGPQIPGARGNSLERSSTISEKSNRRGYEKRDDLSLERRRDVKKGKETSTAEPQQLLPPNGKKKDDRSASWDRERKRLDRSSELLDPELEHQSIMNEQDHRKLDLSRRSRERVLGYSVASGLPPLRPGELEKEREMGLRRRPGMPPDDPIAKHYRDPSGLQSPLPHPMMSPPRGRRVDPDKMPGYPKGHKGDRNSERDDLPPPLPPPLGLRREHRYPGDLPPHLCDPDYLPMDRLPHHLHPLGRDRDPRDLRGDMRGNPRMDPRDLRDMHGDPRDHPPLSRPLPPDYSPDRYPDFRYGDRELDRYGRRPKDYDLPPMHRDDHLPDHRDHHFPGYRHDDYYGGMHPHDDWDGHYGRYPPRDLLPPMRHSPPPMYRGRDPDRPPPLDRFRDHMVDLRPDNRDREDVRMLDRRPRPRSPDWPRGRDDRWGPPGPPHGPPHSPPIPPAPPLPVPSGPPPIEPGRGPPPSSSTIAPVAAASDLHPVIIGNRKFSPGAIGKRGRDQSPGSHDSWERNSRHGSQSSEGHRSSSSSSQKKVKEEAKTASTAAVSASQSHPRSNRHERSDKERTNLKSSKSLRKRSRSKSPTLLPPPGAPSNNGVDLLELTKKQQTRSTLSPGRDISSENSSQLDEKELIVERKMPTSPAITITENENTTQSETVVNVSKKVDLKIESISTKIVSTHMEKKIELIEPSSIDTKIESSILEIVAVKEDVKDAMEIEKDIGKDSEAPADLSDWSDDDDDELLMRGDTAEEDVTKLVSSNTENETLNIIGIKTKLETQQLQQVQPQLLIPSETVAERIKNDIVKIKERRSTSRDRTNSKELLERVKKVARRKDDARGKSEDKEGLIEPRGESLKLEPVLERDVDSQDFSGDDYGGEESVDYDPISDDELDALMEESEADSNNAQTAGDVPNALDVDWSSLQATAHDSKTSVGSTMPGSIRNRFSTLEVLKRVGISQKWAGKELTEKLTNFCRKETEDDAATKGRDVELKLEHPVAAFHLATVKARSQRDLVLHQMGSFCRALCARQDLWMRRQLCKKFIYPKLHQTNNSIVASSTAIV